MYQWKFMANVEDILNKLNIKNISLIWEELLATCQKRYTFVFFFQLASSSPQQQKKKPRKPRSAIDNFQG